MTPAIVTHEHDGIAYEVQDFRYDGTREKRVTLNSPHADTRFFVPPSDSGVVPRQYIFRATDRRGSAEPDVLASQFRQSTRVHRKRFE